MAFEPFVPLRVLSSYSMLEGAIDPKAIAKLAKERGFPAIAIADRNGLYAAMSFAGAARDAGIQPIIGTLLGVRAMRAARSTGCRSMPRTKRGGTTCATWSAARTWIVRWSLIPTSPLPTWTGIATA